MTAGSMGRKTGKETIHSGHFMVSDFEAEAQDDEENVLLEIPEDDIATSSGSHERGSGSSNQVDVSHRPLVSKEMFAIDSSLTKLFNAMSIAYRHKITSPKWNCFKGLKLRWKEKIRLNNVIWRCWHMQFIKKKRMTVCQFALDVDMHNKPELRARHHIEDVETHSTDFVLADAWRFHSAAGDGTALKAIVLEGKYWKRRLQAVTAEYKKWRIFYKNKLSGRDIKMDFEQNMFSLDEMDWPRRDSTQQRPMEDGDLMEYMDFTDALFSLVTTPQPFAFPNPREIARGTGNSDFIQPGLVQLQPNLEDYFMDIVEPLQEMLAGRGLAPVPEETDFNLDLDPSSLTGTSSSILPSSAPSTSISSPLPSTTPPQHQFPTKVEPVQSQDVEPWITTPTASSPLTLSPSPSSPLHTQNLQVQLRQQQQQQQQQQLQQQQQQQIEQQRQQVQLQQFKQLVQQQEQKQRPQQPPSNALSQSLLQQTSPPAAPSSGAHEFILPHSTSCLSQLPGGRTRSSQATSPSHPQQYPAGAVQQASPVQSPPSFVPVQNASASASIPASSSNAVTLGGARLISIGDGGGGEAQGGGGGGGAVAACPRTLFSRSHSQQDLSEVFAANPFAVPKSLPRRRSHSSGGSSTSSTGGPTPPSPISLQQQQLPVNQVIAVGNEVVSSSQPISAINVGTSSSPNTALLAQLLSTGIPCSASITTNNVINTNTNAPINTISICSSNVSPNLQKTITPGTLIGTTGGSVLLGTQVVRSNINNTISSSISNSNSINKSMGGIVVAGGSSNNSIPVSEMNSKGNLQVSSGPLLFTSISLTPVTPSSMKNLQGPQGSIGKPVGMIFPATIPKMSPPHPPESPSSINLNVPSPSNKPFRPKNEVERVQYKEHRRVCHINAEQKRRCSIKSNFDILHSLIPSVSQNPNAKISKAAMLQKGAEYIHQLKQERQQLTEQADKLKSQIEYLGHEISNAQALLPATGVPMSHSRHSKLREMFDGYVRDRTLTNWKFWIFSLIIESLLESYTTSVSTSNVEDLCRTCFAWLDQHCSLNILRPVVSTSMRKLSTTTNVLSDPKGLPDEIHMRVTKQEHETRHLQHHHHHHQQQQHPR